MNKTFLFLIVLVLAARLALFLSDRRERILKSQVEAIVPQPDNLIEPKPDTDLGQLRVKASGAITFLLAEDNEIYYYKGAFTGNLKKTDYSKVREVIKKYKSQIDPDDLMFIIKSGTGATFKNAIDILDEMTIDNVPPGHYAETEINKEETEQINILKKTKNG